MPLRRQGIALIAALVFAFIVFILVAIGTVASYNNRENALAAVNTTKAQLAAEAGLDEAVNRVWHQVWALNPNAKRTLVNYKNLLNQRSIPVSTALNRRIISGSGDVDGVAYNYSFERLEENAEGQLGSSQPSVVSFKVTSTGTLGSGPGASVRKLEQTLVVASEFPDNYSLLTRSINCTFCHASFQSMDALGGDPEDTPWKPTSVGVLDILQTRGSSGGDFDSDTVIHGSLYSRGNTANWNGSVNFGALASSLTTTFDGGEGTNITSSGKRSLSGEITDCSTITNCPEKGFAAFYKNYPTQKPPGRGWPGAELPGEFPKPIPDTNGNNLVDDTEWDSFVAGLTDSGTITGSFKNFGSDPSWGGTVSGTPSNANLQTNLLLDGTTSPLEIEGTVYVKGDVIIRGQIKGSGRIVAQGNVYVMGDVTYACGSSNAACTDEEYATGTDSDGNRLSQFNLVAGGNVIIGDHAHRSSFHTDGPNTPTTDRSYTLSECAAYPGRVTARPADCNFDNTRFTDADYDVEFTARQIADFNRLELINYFERGGSYRPRFYTRNGDENLPFLPAVAGEPNRWDHFAPLAEGSVIDLGRNVMGAPCDTSGGGCRITITAALLSGTRLGDAVADKNQLLPIAPSGDFEKKLRELWRSSVSGGYVNAQGKGLRFDGLMYSSNAIFALMARRTATTNTANRGTIDIRGAVIAADTGILAPGPGSNQPGFKVYHDQRLRPQIVSPSSDLQLKRNLQQLVKR